MFHNKSVIIVSLCLAFIVSLYSFLFGLESLIDEFDYPGIPLKLDIYWKIGIINSLVLGATLLLLYGISLFNLLFKKILPAKLVIWMAHLNVLLAFLYLYLIK